MDSLERSISELNALSSQFLPAPCQDPADLCGIPDENATDNRGAASIDFLKNWKPMTEDEACHVGFFLGYLKRAILPIAGAPENEAFIEHLEILGIDAAENNTQEKVLALMKGFRETEVSLGSQRGLWDLPDNQLESKIKEVFSSQGTRG